MYITQSTCTIAAGGKSRRLRAIQYCRLAACPAAAPAACRGGRAKHLLQDCHTRASTVKSGLLHIDPVLLSSSRMDAVFRRGGDGTSSRCWRQAGRVHTHHRPQLHQRSPQARGDVLETICTFLRVPRTPARMTASSTLLVSPSASVSLPAANKLLQVSANAVADY